MVVFDYGTYFVKVNDEGSYSIMNKETGVEEHSTRILPDAIRLTRQLDTALKEQRKPVTKSSWHHNLTESSMN